MRNALLILPLLAFLLSGCGVKPNAVDPPESLEGGKDNFPRTYPDPSTDPAPERFTRP
ncbi:MAG TPA: hypothetical protein VEF76_11455 [Patescibacteria group bacterium]|nr:hypothetical protein [Patescibacteria group bacterium]